LIFTPKKHAAHHHLMARQKEDTMHSETVFGLMIGGSLLITGVAVAWTRIPIARMNKSIAPMVIKYAKTNFDKLSDRRGLITAQSLSANDDQQWRTVEDIGVRAFLMHELDTIGHKIGTDRDAQGATAITTSIADPALTPIAMAGFSIYGISTEDLDRVARIEVGPLGGVHLFTWVKSRTAK
jgi:hypothetical protein